MYGCARWVLVVAGVLLAACGSSESAPSDPVCAAAQSCVYDSRDAEVCRQQCFGNPAPACPEGQVCTIASVCCGVATPANVCDSPAAEVCCPASGC
jgi:hypothetical protein